METIKTIKYKSWKVNRCIIIDDIAWSDQVQLPVRQVRIRSKKICYRSLKASTFGGTSTSEGRSYGCKEAEKGRIHYNNFTTQESIQVHVQNIILYWWSQTPTSLLTRLGNFFILFKLKNFRPEHACHHQEWH